jgi:thiol-disulfide isomerase/thioredoxin
MKRSLFAIIGPLVVGAAIHAADPPPVRPVHALPPSFLWWNNGETLPGEISEASPTGVTWKSRIFEEPLELDRGVLLKVDHALGAISPSGKFRFDLRDGSQIFGNLESITAESVTLHSDRCGDLILKRSEVLSVRRLHGEKLVFAGPNGDAGWAYEGSQTGRVPPLATATPAIPPIPMLVQVAGGAVELPYWNRSASLDVKLPEMLDLEVHLRSSRRPDFKLQMGVTRKQMMSIETWDEDVVMRTGKQFKAIRKMAETERDFAVRICWDTKTHKCEIYSPSGELLAEWQVPELPETKAGVPPAEDAEANPGKQFQFVNKGRDLSIEFIRVREWDGTPPPRIDASQPRLELADGRVVAGEISGGSAEALLVRTEGEAGEQSFPLGQVDAMVFSADAVKLPQPKASLVYNDGTYLMGRVIGLKDGTLSAESSFTNGPLTARIEGLRRLRFRTDEAERVADEPVLTDLDKLVVQQTTLHGKLTAAGDDQPRWLSVGALKPVIPLKSLPSEIIRSYPPMTAVASASALFYTKSGDVLPGKLASIDAAGVEFESDLVETRKLPTGNLNAIQFEPPVGADVQGFDAAGWRVLKGNAETVKHAGHEITLQPGTSIGHPFAMQGDALQFAVKARGWSTFRMRVFCNGTDPAKAASIMIAYTGYYLYTGLEEADGQFMNQVCTHLGSGEFILRLVMDDRNVEIQANGMPIQTVKIPPTAAHGAGLIIEPTTAWGNAVAPVTLLKFSARVPPGRTWLPEIALEAKKQALTVPRFRKNNVPKQALIATNGDILRGEIEASTANSYGFRTGLEELRVNRDRVKAIVWLSKPVEGEAVATGPAEMKDLDQSLESYSRYSSADLKQLTDYLQSQVPGIKFKLPEAEAKKVSFRFGGQTVRQALDGVCALFHVTWRADASGVIVISPPPAAGNEITQRIYWLKDRALAGWSDAVKSTLMAKGVPFPAGASVSWNPDARQLIMKNTAAGQAKFAALLESELGGNAGSPTHWLSLTSGARLGLIVDQFGSDSVTGHHPIYGRCTIPFADVCSIQTAPPPPSSVYRALDDWRLAFAPEPVLPEAGGGESSPMLGKTPKPFKLALLGGGDFDFAQQQGKIVVLDFWATWCGPCVKSLPGLIASMSGFPPDQVTFVGLDQGEPPEEVKRFLEIRGWKLVVALDAQREVARQFGVDGIPHTVVIGPDGKVAWAKSGYDPEDEGGAAKMVKQLLSAPAAK